MLSYVWQYVLKHTTELKQKRTRQSWKCPPQQQQQQQQQQQKINLKVNTRLKQATLLLSSAYKGLKGLLTSATGYKQTFPLLLAVCDPHGEMR